jgi:Wax ester synthase-like Acyl-CoA acyltransferase domain/Histidine kinase-, DNA gyrase B-, and HSP90-like ATPase
VATGLERHSAPRRAAFERLSRQDLANLIVEAPDTPMHMAVLTILDGRHLHGSAPEDVLEQVRAHVEERLGRIPELRQVLSHAHPPAGRPVWIDDPHVRVSAHVLAAAVPPPGREPELLSTTEDLFQRLLDRSRPLWEIWLLTGLAEGRWAVFLKVHHAVTDGLGMLRIAEALFDNVPHLAPRDVTSWIPSAAPTWGRPTCNLCRPKGCRGQKLILVRAEGLLPPQNSPAGGEIVVTSRREGDSAHITVQDQGVGIPADSLGKVFHRYSRLENDATSHVGGTGLGLPITKEIVELHGGRIWAASEPGHGATFHFTLPLDRPSALRAA